jgi:hypothetical protein
MARARFYQCSVAVEPKAREEHIGFFLIFWYRYDVMWRDVREVVAATTGAIFRRRCCFADIERICFYGWYAGNRISIDTVLRDSIG